MNKIYLFIGSILACNIAYGAEMQIPQIQSNNTDTNMVYEHKYSSYLNMQQPIDFNQHAQILLEQEKTLFKHIDRIKEYVQRLQLETLHKDTKTISENIFENIDEIAQSCKTNITDTQIYAAFILERLCLEQRKNEYLHRSIDVERLVFAFEKLTIEARRWLDRKCANDALAQANTLMIAVYQHLKNRNGIEENNTQKPQESVNIQQKSKSHMRRCLRRKKVHTEQDTRDKTLRIPLMENRV